MRVYVWGLLKLQFQSVLQLKKTHFLGLTYLLYYNGHPHNLALYLLLQKRLFIAESISEP